MKTKKFSQKIINTTILEYNSHPFNDFTKELKAKCQKSGETLVRMRNGAYVPVSFRLDEDGEPGSITFYNEETPLGDCSFVWEADGKSITSRNFDLIEFEK
jgi:hypothetical protein